MDRFLEELAEALDVDSLAEKDVLADLAEWDSLGVLSVIAMVGAKYRVTLSAPDLVDVRTAGDLAKMVLAGRVL
jgi:acyl carrier protein